MAERMRGPLGQIIVVENVTGAAGTIGVGKVARAAADGYTISIGHWGTHVVNPAIYALQYDALKDFEPVAMIATNPQLIVAKKAVPAQDLQGFIAWLKANAATATQGTAGHGSASHISGVYFQNITGARFQFVPYRGAGPAMQDLVAGQVDLMIDQAANSLPQVVIAKLNAAVVETLADAGVRQRLAQLGQEIPPREQQTPQVLFAYHQAEIEKWWPIIKAANIKGE